jgi:hypothetical protein
VIIGRAHRPGRFDAFRAEALMCASGRYRCRSRNPAGRSAGGGVGPGVTRRTKEFNLDFSAT